MARKLTRAQRRRRRKRRRALEPYTLRQRTPKQLRRITKRLVEYEVGPEIRAKRHEIAQAKAADKELQSRLQALQAGLQQRLAESATSSQSASQALQTRLQEIASQGQTDLASIQKAQSPYLTQASQSALAEAQRQAAVSKSIAQQAGAKIGDVYSQAATGRKSTADMAATELISQAARSSSKTIQDLRRQLSSARARRGPLHAKILAELRRQERQYGMEQQTLAQEGLIAGQKLGLEKEKLSETKRSNKAQENLASRKMSETERHNLAVEREQRRKGRKLTDKEKLGLTTYVNYKEAKAAAQTFHPKFDLGGPIRRSRAVQKLMKEGYSRAVAEAAVEYQAFGKHRGAWSRLKRHLGIKKRRRTRTPAQEFPSHSKKARRRNR